jgi:pimeloyl-ACP methyl ester carboxylesterase
MPNLDPGSTVRLADGRQLGFALYGAPAGRPLFFLHGLPSSRLAAAVIDEACSANDVLVIAPDRPGFGLSDGLPGRRILDLPADIAELADQLGIDRFSLMGISSAMPYVLACAIAFPERLSGVVVAGGLGRLDIPGATNGMVPQARIIYSLALKSPRMAELWMTMVAGAVARSPQLVLRRQTAYLPAVDRAVLRRPDVRAIRANDLEEAFLQGASAAAWEARLHVEDWGFAPGEVGKRIYLWQGAADITHPPKIAEHYAKVLPNVYCDVVADEGALGFIDHMDHILCRMAAGDCSAP